MSRRQPVLKVELRWQSEKWFKKFLLAIAELRSIALESLPGSRIRKAMPKLQSAAQHITPIINLDCSRATEDDATIKDVLWLWALESLRSQFAEFRGDVPEFFGQIDKIIKELIEGVGD
jgi:hypothetical protein